MLYTLWLCVPMIKKSRRWQMMSYSNKYGKCSDRWQGCVLRKGYLFLICLKVLDEQTLRSEIQSFIPCFSMWRYWVSDNVALPIYYLRRWKLIEVMGRRALNGNWGKSPGLASLLFPGNVQGLSCVQGEIMVMIFTWEVGLRLLVHSLDGMSGHHRAKENGCAWKFWPKDLWGPSLVQGSDTPPSKRVFATWAWAS